MFSLQQYRAGFDYILFAIIMYSIIFLYGAKHDLCTLFNNRSGTLDFYIGIALIGFVLWFYFSSKNKVSSIDETKLSDIEREHIIDIRNKLDNLKFAIISGGFAIIIGTFALIDKIIPGFFITLIMTYYADQHI